VTPGSAPWLLRHELRLAWRGSGFKRFALTAGVGGFLWLGYHLFVWSLLRGDTAWAARTLPAALFVLLGAGLWFIFTLMLSQAMTLSVDAFFERGDLDLLLASPLRSRHVFVVRGLGVAIATLPIYALGLTPFAHVGAAIGAPNLLAIYPALAALALVAAAAGMALTAALVRLLGARRARIVAQVLAALVGAALFLGLQLGNLIAPGRSQRWIAGLLQLRDGAGLDRDGAAWLPLRAVLGEPTALLVLAAFAVGAFAAVVVAMARRFAAGTQESMTTSLRRNVAVAAPARFRSGLRRNVLIKEWKLIARDPQLIAHTLLQSLYLLPLAFVWMRNESPQTAIAPAVVVLATTLASGLTWLTVAAEDAPELLASAPVDRNLVRRSKLVAALAPVWLVTLPLTLFLAASNAVAAAIFAVCIAGATVGAGSIHLLLPRPGRRSNLRRRGKGDLLAGSLEFATTLAWPTLTWCLLNAPGYAPLPALVAVGAPLLAWALGRERRRELGAA